MTMPSTSRHAASCDEFELWDLALLRTILAASHSPLLTQLYALVAAARHSRFWGDLKRRSASRQRQHAYQLHGVLLPQPG